MVVAPEQFMARGHGVLASESEFVAWRRAHVACSEARSRVVEPWRSGRSYDTLGMFSQGPA
jgi:hypothetical protein